MLHPAWIEREAPLAACPLRSCRRDGVCRHASDRDPCRRLHQTKDEMRYELAAKLERIAAEIIASRPPGMVYEPTPPGTPAFERKLKFLYDSLRAADQAESARQMAEAKRTKPAGKPAARQKAGGAG